MEKIFEKVFASLDSSGYAAGLGNLSQTFIVSARP